MAITAIPNLLPNAQTETNANATAAQRPLAPTIALEDTVQLTAAQRVYQLYSQGQPVSLIAETLNLTVDQVNTYLNIRSAA